MNKKLIGELELSDGVFDGAKYLLVELNEDRKSVHFTLLSGAKEAVDVTDVGLFQDRGELFTEADRWADRCMEKAARIEMLEAELAECKKQLEQKQ